MAIDLKAVQTLIKNAVATRWQDKSLYNISHNHKFWSANLAKYALTLPQGTVRDNLLTISLFVSQHPEMCYQDFVDHFKAILDDPTVEGLLTAFKDRPHAMKQMALAMKADHPNIAEAKWHTVTT